MSHGLRPLGLLLATAALLGGCAAGPDYARPSVEVPAAYRESIASAQEVSDAAWWKQFGDPVLDALIVEAIAGNYSAKIALANVETASSILTQQQSALYPQVGYQGKGQRRHVSGQPEINGVQMDSSGTRSSYSLMLSASWELDLWGRVRRLSESAQANIDASEAARRGVVLSVVGSVANGYIQLRSLDEQLVIAKRALATYAEAVRLFELQFKYGQISLVTLQQSRSQYQAAAAVIPQIQNNIEE
jgi:multidrug efflux system outer membrane protein